MAAGMERVAFGDALDGQPAAAGGAVDAEAFGRVARARRVEAADRTEQLREGELVDPDQEDEEVGDQLGLRA